jgi:hypothetical protein
VGAEQGVDEVPDATALPAAVDGAHGLQLTHDLRHVARRDADHAGQLLAIDRDLVTVGGRTENNRAHSSTALSGRRLWRVR